MLITTIRDFVRHESFGGMLLVFAAAAALLLANSGWARYYDVFTGTRIAVSIDGVLGLDKPVLLWINDGLMAIFFLVVGLEIKRELMEGELSSFERAALPACAAVGGMVVPALIYVAVNWGDALAMRGWAIPAATDIAFALGVLALLGDRVPFSLKLFLLALAVLDDLGAIVIIAIFYTGDLSGTALAAAAAALAVLTILNWRGVASTVPYILVGVLVWLFVLKSGVHATLAGVVVALTIPLRRKDDRERSPAAELEASLHPTVAYVILPLFAFANAGVSLQGIQLAALVDSVPLGIALGLFAGKQLGIFGASWLAVRTGICRKPEDTNWMQLYGVAVLGGIGFTMSLFIGTLAFGSGTYDAGIRIGVLGGSLISAITGFFILLASLRRA